MLLRSYRKLAPRCGLQAELAALQAVEQSAPGDCSHETLLLWEAESTCAVLPRAGSAIAELATPDTPGVPVIRRESGGGAVLLGPGCLNYALVLSLEQRPSLLHVEDSYREILSAVLFALSLPGAEAIGSDLVWHGRKFAGHAQRRTRRAILHHGTLLYDFDLKRISRTLREPKRQPHYRRGRTHDRFLVNAPVTLEALLEAFAGLYGTPAVASSSFKDA